VLPILLGLSAARAAEVARESGLVAAAGYLLTADAIAKAADLALTLVDAHHRAHPAEPGMPLETLRQGLSRSGAAAEPALQRTMADGRIVLVGGMVRAERFRPSVAGGDALLEQVVRLVERGGLTPPTTAEIESELKTRGVPDALRLAARDGRIEAVERDRYFSRSALERFRDAITAVAARGPITPPALRDETGLSRKFLIPLLEWSDRTGLTVRGGEARVLGRSRRIPLSGA
jgi:selenocysteine-specific elongation factor